MGLERLELDELVEHWTLLDGERELVAGKRGAMRLVFALMLKFYGHHGRFPDGDGDLPGEVVEFVARQVQVSAVGLQGYEFAKRTVEYHRAQIRQHFGYRECSVQDAEAIQRWLAEHVARADPRHDVVHDELLALSRRWRVEPLSEGRIDRIVRAAIHAAQSSLTERITSRIPAAAAARMDALIAVVDEEDAESDGVLGLIKSAAANVSLETMLVEIEKLEAVRAIALPAGCSRT